MSQFSDASGGSIVDGRTQSKTSFREKLSKWKSTKIVQWGGLHDSRGLTKRRFLARLLDDTRASAVGRLLGGYVPLECSATGLQQCVIPSIGTEPGQVAPTVFNCLYDQSIKLVIHDDALNWQKFYVFTALHGALVGVFGSVLQMQDSWRERIGLDGIALLGIICALVMDATLQESMRCLRAARATVDTLDRSIIQEATKSQTIMFCGASYNHRDALEFVPVLLLTGWTILSVVGPIIGGKS